MGLQPAPTRFVCAAVENYSRIYNYSADAGAGSQIITNISESPGWRAALLGTVAAGALWLGLPRYARAGPDACVLNGIDTATCTGDQSDGISSVFDFPNIYTTLNVNNLTTGITPASGVDGIYFHGATFVNITSDTTPFSIFVTGAGADGIDAAGSNAVTINHTGDITSTNGRGIYAYSSTETVDVTTNGDVTGGQIGISATNSGTGALTIIANGDVEGTSNIGIYARNNAGADADGISLSIVANGDVIGGNRGIDARNTGTGALTIAANGDVEGTGSYGIYARNDNGTNINITTEGEVTGGVSGFFVRNFGTGALTVEANGDVIGGNSGIAARNYGTGALSIVANGDVEGTAGNGILALNINSASTGPLTITSEGVTGGSNGINARNYGTGALIIEANGDVAGIGSNGIFAQQSNAAATGDLSIATEGVTGATGIFALNNGTGALTVTANGDVVGTGGFGIFARSEGVDAMSGISLSIASEGVTGGTYGIRALNFGTGALSIVTNGDVVGTSDTGIYALQNNSAAGPLSITSEGSVTGGQRGIAALTFAPVGIEIVANGDVTGTNGAGIYAGTFNGPIDITVGSGAIVAGGTAGVQFDGGAPKSLTNRGTIRNLNGIGGTAILGNTGNKTVDNFGVVTGNVLLIGGGINEFNNMDGGLFNSGPTVDLGAGNLLTNDGTLSPGGVNTILTTALTGNFAQPGSVFEVNLQGSQADRLDVSGSAALNGEVKPLFTLSDLTSATQWTILTSGTPIQDNGISAVSTPVVQFDLIFPLATQMDLALLGVDFAVNGLNRNETAIAENLNEVFAAGNFPKLDTVMNAIAFLPSAGAVANALDQLSPEIYLDTEIATLFSAANFTSSLMTCPVRDGAAAFIKEGQCVWARLSGRQFEQDATFQTLGFDETSWQVAGGGQFALGPVWRLGMALGYEHSDLETDTNAKAEGDRFNGGVALKYNPGALLLAGAVSGGWGSYDTDRRIAFPGFAAHASGDNDIGTINGRLRAAYQLGMGNWYAKPMVDLDATHIDLDGVNETGAGGVGLNVRGSDETVLSASPALELGAQFGNPNGTLVRPYVRGGATFYDDPDFVLLASFEGAPDGVGPFRIASSTDDVLANVGAGVDVIGVEGASFRLYYEGRFSDLVEEHTGGLKATLPF